MAEEGLFANLYKSLSAIIPSGINPLTFFSVFIIVFAVVFSVLRKMELFKDKDGKENRGAIALIALVFSFVVAISPEVSKVISFTLPGTGVIMIGILVVFFTLALIVPDTSKLTGKMSTIGIPVILVILVILILVFTGGGELPESTNLLNSFNIGIMTFTAKDLSLVIIGAFIVISFLLMLKSGLRGKEGGK